VKANEKVSVAKHFWRLASPAEVQHIARRICGGCEIDVFGRKFTRGWLLVNQVLSGFAAYRMQLFLYLKACGREELNTANLWAGVDSMTA